MRTKFQKPRDGFLAAMSLLWIAFGAFGTVWYPLNGFVLFGGTSVALCVLSAGLWLSWNRVRIPLLLYWLTVGVLGMIGFLSRPGKLDAIVETALPFVFLWKVYFWDPDEPDFLELRLSD